MGLCGGGEGNFLLRIEERGRAQDYFSEYRKRMKGERGKPEARQHVETCLVYLYLLPLR